MLLFEKIAEKDYEAEINAAGESAGTKFDEEQAKQEKQRQKDRAKAIKDAADRKRRELKLVKLPNGKTISLNEYPGLDVSRLEQASGSRYGSEFDNVKFVNPTTEAEAYHNGLQNWKHTPGARRFLIEGAKSHFDRGLELDQARARGQMETLKEARGLRRHMADLAYERQHASRIIDDVISHNRRMAGGMLGVAGLGGLGLLALSNARNAPVVLPSAPTNPVQYEADYYH